MTSNPIDPSMTMSSSYEQQQVSSTIPGPPVAQQSQNQVPLPMTQSSPYTVASAGAAFIPSPLSVCRFCGMAVTPIVSNEPTAVAYLLCLLFCLLLPCIGILIGIFILMSNEFRRPRYTCPSCGNYMPIGQPGIMM